MSEVTAVNPLSDTGVDVRTGLVKNERTDPQNDKEVLKSVDELLDLVSNKFSKISAELFAKMDEMAQRLDELEATIKEHMYTDPDLESGLLEPLEPLEPLELLGAGSSSSAKRGS